MTIELKIQLKGKENLTNKQIVKQKPKSNKEYPFKWTDANKDEFNDDEFKFNCNRLNEKLKNHNLKNKEILQELIKVKDRSIKSRRKETFKYHRNNSPIYSEDTRKSRHYYKTLVNLLKKDKNQEHLSEMLQAKKGP